MFKAVREVVARVPAWVFLVVEIVVFYGGFGWFFGVWNPDYQDDYSGIRNVLAFFYLVGVFSFLFFVFALPPRVVGWSFIRVMLVFVVVALPCFFLSFALSGALSYGESYIKSLEGTWSARIGAIPFLTLHALGFVVALFLRKIVAFVTK